MSLRTLVAILFSVALSAAAQIVLKHGMSQPAVQHALGAGGTQTAWAVAGNAYVVGGLALYALGALVWLLVLARVDVSVAYPFVGLGFVLTMVFATLVLGEPLQPLRILGTLLIAAGVVLVARSA